MKNKKYDLEDRLIDFGVLMIKLSESMDRKRFAGRHLCKQLVRSGTSPCLNYGEAQAAESRKDFSHKLKIVLKELRETRRCLRLSNRAGLFNKVTNVKPGIDESAELIAIFVKSIQTAEKGEGKKQTNRETENG